MAKTAISSEPNSDIPSDYQRLYCDLDTYIQGMQDVPDIQWALEDLLFKERKNSSETQAALYEMRHLHEQRKANAVTKKIDAYMSKKAVLADSADVFCRVFSVIFPTVMQAAADAFKAVSSRIQNETQVVGFEQDAIAQRADHAYSELTQQIQQGRSEIKDEQSKLQQVLQNIKRLFETLFTGN